VGGRLKRKGIDVYIQPIHSVVQQKVTQQCNVIVLQFLKKENGQA